MNETRRVPIAERAKQTPVCAWLSLAVDGGGEANVPACLVDRRGAQSELESEEHHWLGRAVHLRVHVVPDTRARGPRYVQLICRQGRMLGARSRGWSKWVPTRVVCLPVKSENNDIDLVGSNPL